VLPKAYIETSIVSYLASRPSREPLAKVHQELTHEWWERRRSRFDLYISEVVLEEASRGDAAAASARLAIVESLPILNVDDQARALAAAILRAAALPAKSAADAMHIAVATVNAMEFLLSWNCTHIANAIVFRRVSAICRGMGFDPPAVCTPEELMEG
jgi:predicted nucleic acid-binding protein